MLTRIKFCTWTLSSEQRTQANKTKEHFIMADWVLELTTFPGRDSRSSLEGAFAREPCAHQTFTLPPHSSPALEQSQQLWQIPLKPHRVIFTLELKRDLHPSCEVKSQVWKPTQNTGSCPRAWGFPSHLLHPPSPFDQYRNGVTLTQSDTKASCCADAPSGWDKKFQEQKNTPGCSERQTVGRITGKGRENREHFFVPR